MSEFEIIELCLEYSKNVVKLNEILKNFTGNKYLIKSAIEDKINEYNNEIVKNINIIKK